MKIMCSRDELLGAFQTVAAVVPSRSPKPILLNVKLAAESDRVTLLATDLEVGIRCNVDGVEVQKPGQVILPTAKVLAILRESTDPQVEIETHEHKTHIRGQRSRFQLTSDAPEEFPDVPDFVEEKHHLMSSTMLRTMIRRTAFATEAESTRYALNGLLVELEGNRISLVGTDGRRLAVVRGNAVSVGGHSTKDFTPVVPTKAMNLIDRTLQEEEEVALAIEPNRAVLRSKRAVISSRLVEGRFPRYQEVFPSRSEASVSLNVRDLLQAVRQAMIVTSEESRGVDFAFNSGTLTLSGHSAEVGESLVEIPVAYDAKEITITFDPRYVVDFLRVLNEESAVGLDLIDHQSAAVFKTDDGYAYVVMPLTRER